MENSNCSKKRGYAWAVSAGLNAALSATSAKFFSSNLFIRYGMVIFFNVTMWGCYVNSMRALSSLQATVTNFATNFLFSGLAGFFLFGEALSFKAVNLYTKYNKVKLRHSVAQAYLLWFAGAFLITVGVLILSKSNVEKKKRLD